MTGKLGGELTTSEGITLPLMTEYDVGALSARGFDIMPHSRTHPMLDVLVADEAVKEIESSRVDVERITGKTADMFAYPKGRYTDDIVRRLKNGGWRAAVTVRQDLVRTSDDPLLLPRANITKSTTMEEFRMKTSGALGVYSLLNRKQTRR